MSEHLQHNQGIGPYRLVRNRGGVKSYFAGHHENGQPQWAEDQNLGVHYPSPGMASEVQRALVSEAGDTLNVVRIS